MSKSKDTAQISAADWRDAESQLNFILQRLIDRIDKLEGLRDTLETEGGGAFKGPVTVTDETDTEVHSMS